MSFTKVPIAPKMGNVRLYKAYLGIDNISFLHKQAP